MQIPAAFYLLKQQHERQRELLCDCCYAYVFKIKV